MAAFDPSTDYFGGKYKEAAGAAPNLAFVVDLVALEDQTAGTITLKVDVSEDDVAALLEKQPQKKDLLDLALGCQE